MKFCVSGKFLNKDHMGGQERYSYEILRELDKMIKKDEVEIVVPYSTKDIPVYENIKVVKFGNKNGILWEQIDFLRYIKKNNGVAIYLCNTFSVFRPDIVTLHDAAVFAIPELALTFYGKLSREYHRLLFKIAARRSKVVFTISHNAMDELNRFLKIRTNRFYVVDCGWQHMERIIEDDTIFDKHKEIAKGQYFVAVSSRVPHKNFKWIEDNAQFNPQCKYVIVGKKVRSTVKSEKKAPDNVTYVGAVTDGELKSLMANCRAIIHPALYEGFGMTPIEAMSVGAKAIVSSASCLPEIYGHSVHYIEPNNPKVDLNLLLKEMIEPNEVILNKYSWKHNAEKLLEIIRTYNN